MDSQYVIMSAMKGTGVISGKPGSAQIILKMKFYYTNGSLGVIIILYNFLGYVVKKLTLFSDRSLNH